MDPAVLPTADPAPPKKLSTTRIALLRALMEHHGIAAVAKASGIGREPLVRAIAGLPLRMGTMTALVHYLEKLETREQ